MIQRIMFLPNGNTAVFNEKGQQIPELQGSWLLEFIKAMMAKTTVNIELVQITLPDGKRARLFKLEKDLHWEVIG